MYLKTGDKFHLFARAGFFAHQNELPKMDSLDRVVDAVFEKQKTVLLDFDLPKIDRDTINKMSKKERRELRSIRKKQVEEINQIWLKQMMDLDKSLIEKMTLFWHGHFACKTNDNPEQTLDLNNRLRQHALGDFRSLLFAVSESPAMINYLHLRQNKKGKPNEDFARELCELFTLGRDVDYTEKDVVEIARAFTGWTVNREGKHVINERQRDVGEKIIFGQRGNFSGEDVLNMILDNPNTAYFISTKIYRFFVREKLFEPHVRELSEVFYNSGYNIKVMMTHLFKASWFYEAKGELIKSPIELLVTFGRLFDLRYEKKSGLIRVQKYLGQVLFSPPNVAGWAGGRSWIDSSRLAFRLRLGSLIINKGVVEDQLSPDLDEVISKRRGKKRLLELSEEIDWDNFFSKNKEADLIQLLIRSKNETLYNLGQESDCQKVIQLISTPDFQLT